MKTAFLSLLFLFAANVSMAQKDSARVPSRMLIIPYQSMMYFSDADPDIARFSKSTEKKVRDEMRANVDANVHHQLLVGFDAISLMRSPSLSATDDLSRIYGATRYSMYSPDMKADGTRKKSGIEIPGMKSLSEKFAKKSKEQTFWTCDTAVMLANIGDPELFAYLGEKYNEKFILFITQFEVVTDHKNSIEWMKQSYSREFIIHYNLFDRGGNLLRAQTLTLTGGNDNSAKTINDKYLTAIAMHLKDLLLPNDR
jgi:hypothetical protein